MDYKKIIKSRALRLRILRMLSWVPDVWMVRLQYRIHTGRVLDIRNPKRFTEKLQHYKLYYRNPVMWQCVDKFEVREYIKEHGFGQYLNEFYGVYNSVYDIDFNVLPSQFVLKTTNGGGNLEVYICKENNDIARAEIIELFKNCSERRKKSPGREYAYDGIKRPRIIVEKLLVYPSAPSESITDYKFFCFKGKVTVCQLITERSTEEHIDYYDTEWNRLTGLIGLNTKATNSKREFSKPVNYEEMVFVAQELSKDFPFVRVDLYNIEGKIVFGELTFYPASGYGSFVPDSFDFELGKAFEITY